MPPQGANSKNNIEVFLFLLYIYIYYILLLNTVKFILNSKKVRAPSENGKMGQIVKRKEYVLTFLD